MSSKRWSEEEIEYLINNYENQSITELVNKLGSGINSIRLKANRLGLEKSRNYTNLNYFDEINTEEKAYWLGFIFADGFVSVNDYGYEFGIELSSVDIKHLEKLKISMDSESPIKVRTRSNGVEVCNFRVYRKELVTSLINQGVVTNKTFKIRIPNISENLHRHFIRGYFDGDGYVSMHKRTSYGVNIRTGFVCGSLDFVKDIVLILNNNLNLQNKNSIYSESKNIHNFQTTNRKDALLILNYLYKDSTVYLDRKYKKYLEILKFVNEVA